MDDRKLMERIVVDSDVMVGKPVIKGTRLTVGYVLNLLAHGADFEEITGEYEGVDAEDIRACLLFAGRSVEDNTFVPFHTPS